MKIKFLHFFFVIGFLVSSNFTRTLASEVYVIKNDHSTIDFETTYLTVQSVKGHFSKFKGRLKIDLASQNIIINEFDLIIESSSINTRNRLRDRHLEKTEWLDTKNFKNISLSGKNINISKNAPSNVPIMLKIKDIEKTIKFKITYLTTEKDPWSKDTLFRSAEGKINRKHFNLNWNYLTEGKYLVGDIVKLNAVFQIQKVTEQTEWSKHYVPLNENRGKNLSSFKIESEKIEKSEIGKNKPDLVRLKNQEINTKNDKSFPWSSFFLITFFGFVGATGLGFCCKYYGRKYVKENQDYILDLILISIVIAYSYGVYNVYLLAY